MCNVHPIFRDLRLFLLIVSLTSEVLPSNLQLYTPSFVFTCRFYKVFGRYLLCCVRIGLDWIQILGHRLDWTGLGSVARGFGLDWIVSNQSILYSGKLAHHWLWSVLSYPLVFVAKLYHNQKRYGAGVSGGRRLWRPNPGKALLCGGGGGRREKPYCAVAGAAVPFDRLVRWCTRRRWWCHVDEPTLAWPFKRVLGYLMGQAFRNLWQKNWPGQVRSRSYDVIRGITSGNLSNKVVFSRN